MDASWTVSMWVKTDVESTSLDVDGLVLFRKGENPSDRVVIRLKPYIDSSYNNARITLEMDEGNFNLQSSLFPLDPWEWTMVTVMYDEVDERRRIYRNGFLVGEDDSSFPASNVTLGVDSMYGSIAGNPSIMTNMRIYSTALSAETVLDLYQNNPSFSHDASLVSGFILDGGSVVDVISSNTIDVSGGLSLVSCSLEGTDLCMTRGSLETIECPSDALVSGGDFDGERIILTIIGRNFNPTQNDVAVFIQGYPCEPAYFEYKRVSRWCTLVL